MCYNKTNNRPNVFVGSLIVLTEQFMIRELGVSKRRARLFVTGEAQTLEQGTHLWESGFKTKASTARLGLATLRNQQHFPYADGRVGVLFCQQNAVASFAVLMVG